MFVAKRKDAEIWIRFFDWEGEVVWTSEQKDADQYTTVKAVKDMCELWGIDLDTVVVEKV